MNFVCETPPHLSRGQFAELQPKSCDSTLTKRAKAFIEDSGYLTTPLSKSQVEIATVTKGKTSEVLKVFTPTKSTNGIYRWKVEVLEKDEVVAKRLIGKSCSVRKRLNSYFTSIRAGHTAIAKAVLHALKKDLSSKGLKVSFGVIHNSVPDELLGRVEDLMIKVHKASCPQHVLNQRGGGGGASRQKPLSERDIKLISKVSRNIQTKNLPSAVPFTVVKGKIQPKLSQKLCLKRGVIYHIENVREGKHYIGKTEALFKRRISQHVSAINTAKRQKSIHRAICKNPKDFVLRVLYTAPSSQRHVLPAIEAAYIQAFRSHEIEYGYNSNKGSRFTRA